MAQFINIRKQTQRPQSQSGEGAQREVIYPTDTVMVL
jgi:hypothetical protein